MPKSLGIKTELLAHKSSQTLLLTLRTSATIFSAQNIWSLARPKFTSREMNRYCKSLPIMLSKSQLMLCVLNDEEREDKQAEVDLQVYDLTSSLLYPASCPTATLKLAASELGGEHRGFSGETGPAKRESKRLCSFSLREKEREKNPNLMPSDGGLKRSIALPLTSLSHHLPLCVWEKRRRASAHWPPRQLRGDEWRPRPIGSLSMHVQVDRIEFNQRNDRPFFFLAGPHYKNG